MRKTTLSLVAILAGLLIVEAPALSDDGLKFAGAWKLVAFDVEDVDTEVRTPVYGERPWGYMLVGAHGRFSAWASSDSFNRGSGNWRAADFYFGKYRAEGPGFFIQVDGGFHEGLVGSPFDLIWSEGRTKSEEQRFIQLKFDAHSREILVIETPPMPNPNGAGNTIIGKVTWARTADWGM